MPDLRPTVFLTLAAAFLASACSHTAMRQEAATSRWSGARQLVLVTTTGWDANQGSLRTFNWTATGWQPVGAAAPVTIGRAGSAWGVGLHGAQPGPVKREGDGRAPAGVFSLGPAFGYAATTSTALRYLPMTASHYCVDVSGSPMYNQIVDARKVGMAAVAGSTEPMRLDIHGHGDQRYKNGLVIGHNPKGVPGAGSCIFVHLWKAPGETTAGCTAMAEPVMDRLQAWLRPEQHPVFVLLPESEVARLQMAWQLPERINP